MKHVPVLLSETLNYLNISRFQHGPGIFVDATFGGGGHCRAILEHAGPQVRVIAIDRDQAAVHRSAELRERYGDRFLMLQGNFADLSRLLDEARVRSVDGLLLDLGLSSYQLGSGPRGFSFQLDGPLDMRMDRRQERTAADIVATCPAEQLQEIFQRFGEEPYAKSIAKALVAARAVKAITTTRELAELIMSMTPPAKAHRRIHPATKVFQALRIAVNGELQALVDVLSVALERLNPAGRLVVIAYHSLEDRIVKQMFRQWAARCLCPPDLPVCACGVIPRVRLLQQKAVVPQAEEKERNPRSRSARLRAVERL
ncbi:MAG: 16S rRNA (cytosine(1402)-N(4))-methyltransferase RsmH [Deltaproteobacteria bacterium]|nr:16S rRNA (cytosine(1402)-N(4))-methyltransferase RsmH [Candidatus Anaeroferrophillus wilburensis]MBN2888987.1 16S rRNA (cytosine(1402)-N(4))-methyltransferase RsmH [Deltaproteobacteria bacterium]